jgi:hypothetical protein
MSHSHAYLIIRDLAKCAKTIAPVINGTLQLLCLWSFHEFDLTMFPKECGPEVTDADLAGFECQASWKYDGFDEDF